VPLPDVAGEGVFGVDLVLVHVDFFAKNLLDRIDHARMGAEQAKRLVVEMGRKRGARRAALFAPDFGALLAVDRLGLVPEQFDLLRAEQLGQKQPAFGVETFNLLRREFHGISSLTPVFASRAAGVS
jgi:hypothetical protein